MYSISTKFGRSGVFAPVFQLENASNVNITYRNQTKFSISQLNIYNASFVLYSCIMMFCKHF